MKVSYNYTINDLKKFLIKSRRLNNIILFIIGIIIYILFTIKNISLVYMPIFILIFIIAIYLLNKLYIFAYIKVNDMLNYNVCGKYIIELTPNKFSVTVNSKKIDYKYNQIKKVKVNKDNFKLAFKKSRNSLIFEKKFFTEEEYVKIINMFKDKIN